MRQWKENSVCLVADGASPIGKATGIRLAREGMRLVLCCPHGERMEEPHLEALTATGCRCRVECVDFTDVEDIRAMAARVESDGQFGCISAMFYNIIPPVVRQPILNMSLEQISGMIDTSVTQAFLAAKVIGGTIARHNGGSMVFLGSLHGDKPTGVAPLTSMYMGALKNMSREAAMFFGTGNVRSNLIELGAMGGEDQQYRNGLSKFYEGYQYKIPSGYVGGAEDVVSLALYLLCEESGYINGAEIRMDGGLLLQYVDVIANTNALKKAGRAGNG